MTYRKLLLILAAGVLLLTLLLLKFVPWEALITLLFLLGITVSPGISQLLQIAKARLTPIPHYRPSPEQPPSKSTYEQGYQEQPPASSTSWSSYRTWGNDQPKQDPPGAWDQHQVQYPEQAPPQIQCRPVSRPYTTIPGLFQKQPHTGDYLWEDNLQLAAMVTHSFKLYRGRHHPNRRHPVVPDQFPRLACCSPFISG